MRNIRNITRYLAFVVFTLVSTSCWSTEESDSVCTTSSDLENDWAKVRYQTPVKLRIQAFETMLTAFDKAPQQCLETAEYLIIQAMIKGSIAKQQSGFSALKKIKKIKQLLDNAMTKNPAAMDGMGWILLGLLYDKSPGWPLSIGDDDKAESAYRKGLEYDPTGIDANFYYGDFLRRKDLPLQAQHYLLKASQAKQSTGREIAYHGRLKDVQRALSKLPR